MALADWDRKDFNLGLQVQQQCLLVKWLAGVSGSIRRLSFSGVLGFQ